MKILKILLCLFITPIPVWATDFKSDSVDASKIIKISEAVRKEYAPDKRTALFQVNADSSGNYTIETTEPKAAEKFLTLTKAESVNSTFNFNILPEKSLGENIFGLVNVSVGNIRSNPQNAAELATQSLLGTPLDILKKEGYYYLIRTPDGYVSWLDAGAITFKTATEINDWKKKDKLVFIDDYGHAFSHPDIKSQRISDLVMGNILVNAGSTKGFFKVIYPDGREGFIPQNQVTDYAKWINKSNPKPEQVIEIAKTMIGVPYLWGGTSVKGVDCSGFTKTAFFMNGIVIPRDASQQVLVGEPVTVHKNDTLDLEEALKNLKPGDLIFFASGKNRPLSARVTHVAMYIGHAEFIHASGQVRINSMKPDAANYNDFQTRTIVAARRFIGSIHADGITPIAKHPAYSQK